MMFLVTVCIPIILTHINALSALQNLKPGDIPLASIREVSSFSEVDTTAPFTVFVDVDPHNDEKVVVTGLNRTVMDWIVTNVQQHVLKISYNPPRKNTVLQEGGLTPLGTGNSGFSIFGSGTISINGITISGDNPEGSASSKDCEIFVSAKSLLALTVSGAGNMEVKTNINSSTFAISAAGSGDLSVPRIDTDSLDVAVTGSGNVRIGGGNVGTATLGTHGSGNLEAENMQIMTATAAVSGSGHMKIAVMKTLMGSVSGMGSIMYKGDPQTAVQTVGMGSIRKF